MGWFGAKAKPPQLWYLDGETLSWVFLDLWAADKSRSAAVCLSGAGAAACECRVPVRLRLTACGSPRGEAALGHAGGLPGSTSLRPGVPEQVLGQRAEKQLLLAGQKGQSQRAVEDRPVRGAPGR